MCVCYVCVNALVISGRFNTRLNQHSSSHVKLQHDASTNDNVSITDRSACVMPDFLLDD